MARKERQMAQQEMSAEQSQPKIAFEAWWALMQKRMPPNHHKEIVMADFRARGLSMQEPMAVFEKALADYGVKLK